MTYYIFLGIGAFLMSLLGTRLTLLALRQGKLLLDIPNSRSNHRVAVPRGGGIAVVMTLVIFLQIIDASYLVLVGVLLLAIISLIDDWIHLSPLTRIIVQAMVVLLVLPEAGHPWFSFLPGWMDLTLRALAWLWFINLFNFMDGIDGLAAGETVCVALGLLAITIFSGTFSNPLSLESLILLGAAGGFLWWNWHPARIFLGDVGSVPLGFYVGYLLVRAGNEHYGPAAAILPAYFLMDATITLLLRLRSGAKPWQPHSQHFYQRAVRMGRSHAEVVRLVLGVNTLLIMLAVLTTFQTELVWLNVVLAYVLCTLLLWYWSRPHEPAA